MTDTQLREQLEKLRREIDRIAGDDPKVSHLGQLIDDLEHKLAKPSDTEHHDRLLRGLKDTISEFETEHPRATAILNDILVFLSNMGI